ncbi:hypothetical protein HYX13_04200 [Candidatus Woesearchaeota archaeon]|nr:hypothetical protein [Candidatus Woesearchaeota archaeon]
MTLTTTLRNTLFYGTLCYGAFTGATALGFSSQAYADEVEKGETQKDGTHLFTLSPEEMEEYRKKQVKTSEPVIPPLPPVQDMPLQPEKPLSSEIPAPALSPVPAPVEQIPDSLGSLTDPLQGAPGYILQVKLVPKDNGCLIERTTDGAVNGVSKVTANDTTNGTANGMANETANSTVTEKSCADTSVLEKTISALKGDILSLQKKVQTYLSSRDLTFSVYEGMEQVGNRSNGLFTGVNVTLHFEDWIAARLGMNLSYARTSLAQVKNESSSGITSLEDHLQERWSHHLLEMDSSYNSLAWEAEVLLGSLDGNTLGRKGLELYALLGVRVRLAQESQLIQEERTSQLLYRGVPREPLRHYSTEVEKTLVPYFVPTFGGGVCYLLGAESDATFCFEVNLGIRSHEQGTSLELGEKIGLRFKF